MWQKALALFRSTHPLPSLSVTSIAVLFGIGVGLPLQKLLLVGLAVLAQQFSVGLSNDWLDAGRDKAVKRMDKPLAQGLVPLASVRTSSIASAVIALTFAFSLGIAAFLWMLLMLAIGWVYNLGLKANGFSVVPYILGFGILPAFVTLSGQDPALPPVWVMIVAGVFGIAAHFANTLPDLLADKQTGIRALPHILGQKASALVIAVTASSASIILVTQGSKLNPLVSIGGLGLTVALSLLASILALRPNPPKLVFHLLLVASLVNVVMLMLGIQI
jgi:4-hydroxybenzoate polyprenyltransferase